jgi:uncharacterized protein (DUF2345 family)
MSWNGQVPTNASWQGNPQFAGDEVLYITPDPPTTATNPSIGIVDGNVIPLPTAYNTFNVATLGATTLNSTTINNSGTITSATGNITTINSTTINNSGNIQTETINGLTPSTIANTWSLFPAVSDVVANQVQATAYVPLQTYIVGEDASLGSPVYTNYECAIAGATMNPLERLDDWLENHTYNAGVDWGCLYEGVEYITIANNVGDVLPTNTAYFRPANYDNAYGYSADDIVYQPTGISPGWYQSDNGSTGTAPPNLFAWTPINFWILAPYVPDPAWDIKGFKDVQSASVHTDELTVANQTTLGDGGDALVVNGGTTLDGGALHGTTIGSLPVSGINTVRLDILPAGIEATSITGIIMNSTLATEIAAGGGLVLAAGGAASLAAGGALSLAGGGYIEYNTDENRFINTSSGNDFTDILVGNIFPAFGGSANLRINGGGSGRFVEIADAITIATQDLNVTNISAPTTLDITSGDGTIITGGTGISIVSTAGNISASAAAEINLTAVTNINVDTDATIEVTAVGDINFTSTGETNIQSGGSLVLNSSTADASLFASTNIAITSTTSSVAITSGTDISLNPTGVINLNTKNVTNANTITGAGNLNLSSTGGGNGVTLTSDVGGYVSLNGPINFAGNSVVNAHTITGANVDVTIATLGNRDIYLSPAGTGTIITNKNLNLNNNNIVGGNIITGTTALTLATLSNNNINLSPNGTGTIVANKTLNMNTNAISGVTTLNGRNLFSYGNFYNDANQTLTATNTATRVKMNTSLNNNLITLDSVTNIGRLTFTNAGVYHVVWNAYLLHGSGGTVKSVIWIRLNGTDVAGSGKTENNDAQQNETNMTSSSLVSVTASQYIEFYWAADSVNVPLTAVAASSPYPATPSFSCSISIVG